MGLFERYLSVWVTLAMVVGVGLGLVVPEWFEAIAEMEVEGVNAVVAILIWLMVYPMMLKVDPHCFSSVSRRPKGLMLTLVINWLVKPFTMAAIGVLFFHGLFEGLVSSADADQYIAGMILLGVAPCTAMVFVWSHMTEGDANYTLVQVSINDLILVVAFAPIAGLLLGVTDLVVPWRTLVMTVILFVAIPLGAGLMTRHVIKVEATLNRLSTHLKPTSMVGLLLTVVLLFGLQAETLIDNPVRVLLIAIPLTLQSYGIFALAYGSAKVMKLRHEVAAPAAMIGTSNFFELAVAVAISLFGLNSGAALATVVGVLIEVPVMLSLVAFANRTRHWFPVEEGRP